MRTISLLLGLYIVICFNANCQSVEPIQPSGISGIVGINEFKKNKDKPIPTFAKNRVSMVWVPFNDPQYENMEGHGATATLVQTQNGIKLLTVLHSVYSSKSLYRIADEIYVNFFDGDIHRISVEHLPEKLESFDSSHDFLFLNLPEKKFQEREGIPLKRDCHGHQGEYSAAGIIREKDDYFLSSHDNFIIVNRLVDNLSYTDLDLIGGMSGTPILEKITKGKAALHAIAVAKSPLQNCSPLSRYVITKANLDCANIVLRICEENYENQKELFSAPPNRD